MPDLETVANVAGVVSLVAILALVFHVLRKIKALFTDWFLVPEVISNIRTNLEVLDGQIQQIESLSTEVPVGTVILRDTRRAKKKAAESKAHLPSEVGGSRLNRFFRRMKIVSNLPFFTDLERQTSQWDDRLARHVTDLKLRAWLVAFHADIGQVDHVAEPEPVLREAPKHDVSQLSRSCSSRPPRSNAPSIKYYAQQRLSQPADASNSRPQPLPDLFSAVEETSRLRRGGYNPIVHKPSGPTSPPITDKPFSSAIRR